MVQISKRKLDTKVLQKLFRLFFEAVGNKNNQEEFQKIIDDLFSEIEKIMIAKRVAIIYLLLKNIDHEVIGDTVKVSSATIAKFSFIKERSQGIVDALRKILRNEKLADFLKDLYIDVIAPPGTYKTNWKAGWQRKIQREEEKRTGI